MKQAAVIIAPKTINGILYVAGTTRVESSGYGLPGGKQDPGESIRDCAIREAFEEGFAVYGVDPKPCNLNVVGEFLVSWFLAESAEILNDFKEKGRIAPKWITLEELGTNFGNGCVGEYLKQRIALL